MSEALTIGRMATELGVSTHTLRYYEQAGLLLPVARTQAGHRLYARTDTEWLRFVMRLKATGMPIAGIQAFAELRARGDETVADRLALLVEHREAVLTELAQLQTNLGAIDEKIAHYERLARDMTGRDNEPQSEKDSQWTTRTRSRTRTQTSTSARASTTNATRAGGRS